MMDENIKNSIQNLIDTGISQIVVSRETGVARNTVHRIFTGETSLDKVSVSNAEPLFAYYSKIERNMSEAIAIVNYLVEKVLEDDRKGLSYAEAYPQLLNRPYDVYNKLVGILNSPSYKAKAEEIKDYFALMSDATSRILEIDQSIIGSLKLTGRCLYIMSQTREYIRKLVNANAVPRTEITFFDGEVFFYDVLPSRIGEFVVVLALGGDQKHYNLYWNAAEIENIKTGEEWPTPTKIEKL